MNHVFHFFKPMFERFYRYKEIEDIHMIHIIETLLILHWPAGSDENGYPSC
jgi:hypothetical protein